MLSILRQLLEFQNSQKEDRQSYHDYTKDPLGNLSYYEKIKNRLIVAGVLVEEVAIDVVDFENWLNNFSEIKKYYSNMKDIFIEKCMEHYLAFRHLRISPHDIYIDIAASYSPWANVLNAKGIRSYSLDLVFPKGISGIYIGADAGDTNLPEGFCNVMSLHCAFECFKGDADTRFIQEAARLLEENGRYGIVPLYLDDTYFVMTSPYCDQKDVIVDKDVKKLWRDDKRRMPFSRHYSPEAFQKRIHFGIPKNMQGKVLYFKNLSEVMNHYKGQRIYCFFMFCCEKISLTSGCI